MTDKLEKEHEGLEKPLFCVPTKEEIVRFWMFTKGFTPREWQLELHQRVLESIAYNYGDVFTVKVTRQFGKNEADSIINAHIAQIFVELGLKTQNLKFVPEGETQLRVSKMRFEEAMAENLWVKLIGGYDCIDGFKYCFNWNKKKKEKKDAEKGLAFYSIISAKSSIAGETASHLIVGDEGQDLDKAKWDRDIEPMGNANFATIMMYGVSWTKDALIEDFVEESKRIQEKTGRRCLFIINAYEAIKMDKTGKYKKSFDRALRKYGSLDHIVIKTQYMLQTIEDMNRMLDENQISSIYNNDFEYKDAPEAGKHYAISIDVGGEDEAKTLSLKEEKDYKRDSTAIIIAELDFSSVDLVNKLPRAKVVHLYEFNGTLNTEMYHKVINIIRFWGGNDKASNVAKIAVDATGVGMPLYSHLKGTFGKKKVEKYIFKFEGDNNKSTLGFNMISVINKDLLKIPNKINITSLDKLHKEVKFQLEQLVREAVKDSKIQFYVPQSAKRKDVPGHIGHDDFAMSLCLLCNLLYIIKKPVKRRFGN